MVDANSFNKNSTDLLLLSNELKKYKKYIEENQKEVPALAFESLFDEGFLTLFGAEIFQFWQESLKQKDESKYAFVTYAASVGIPVRDYDLGGIDLSYFGTSLYAVWCQAIK